jgi:hypothetical protein
MKNKILGFKIRHKKTGLFLSSLSSNKWTKIGKTWPRRGDVTRAINTGLTNLKRYDHLRVSFYEKALEDMMNWEIVELTESNAVSMMFYLDKIKS